MFTRWRSVLASFLGVAIAVGGFYTGTASSQTPSPEDDAVKAPDLTKLPPSLNVLVATSRASELKLSEAQVKRLQEMRSKLVPLYVATQRTAWDADLRDGQKMESGEMIPVVSTWTEFAVREIAMPGILSPVHVYGDPIDRTGTILKPDQQKKLAKIAFELRNRLDIDRFRLLFSEEAQESAHFSAKQKKQFSILIRMFANELQGKAGPVYTSSENLGISLDSAVAAVNAPVSSSHLPMEGMRRQYWFSQAMGFLSPLQRVRLEAFLIDKLYVRG